MAAMMAGTLESLSVAPLCVMGAIFEGSLL